MQLSEQIARHFREIYFGGNWTASNLKSNLEDVTWQQAITQIYSLNTIGTLVYHINYYVNANLKVLQGNPLDASDKFSFDSPPILSQKDWENLREKTWADGEDFASLVEQLPDAIFFEPFTDGKYGNYYRNIIGIIEHAHYHLGQIALIKKILSLR